MQERVWVGCMYLCRYNKHIDRLWISDFLIMVLRMDIVDDDIGGVEDNDILRIEIEIGVFCFGSGCVLILYDFGYLLDGACLIITDMIIIWFIDITR